MKWPKGKRLSVLRVTAEALEEMEPELAACSSLKEFKRRFPDGLVFLGKSFDLAGDCRFATTAFDTFLTPRGRDRFWTFWDNAGWTGELTTSSWNFRTFSKLIREGYLSRKGHKALTAPRQKEGG